MTEKKHTPGPWRLVRGEEGWIEIHSRVTGRMVAKLVESDLDDAYLLVALPEMFRAVQTSFFDLTEAKKNAQMLVSARQDGAEDIIHAAVGRTIARLMQALNKVDS